MKRDEALIRQPCSEDWDAMTGDDKRRFCGLCNKNVHNLSAMTEPEARAVVAQQDVCVRYSLDPKGQSIRHRPRRRFVVRAVATAAITAGLALPAAAAISREPGQVGLLSQAWEALTEWASPGPEYVQGGILVDPLPPQTTPAVVTPSGEHAQPVRMGRVRAETPVAEPLMGDIAPTPKPDRSADSR